jgi:2-hydroxycyclohexanecarboxyl-CoA dehydrogenase
LAKGVAIVTGAAGVIGRAVVERMRADGFAVAGLDGEHGAGDLALAVDVTDRPAVVEAVRRATDELGQVSVLVTAHGYHDAAPFGLMSRDGWKRLLTTHLGGTANACAAVVPGMLAAGRGSVITTTSWIAGAGLAGEAYYAAATGSLLAFTKSFALEVASRGVRVNCIGVGPVDDEHDGAVALADVAATVSFLVNEGTFFVGQVLWPSAVKAG